MLAHRVAIDPLREQDFLEVVGRDGVGGGVGKRHLYPVDGREGSAVARGVAAARSVVVVESCQLHAADGGAQLVESVVEPVEQHVVPGRVAAVAVPGEGCHPVRA